MMKTLPTVVALNLIANFPPALLAKRPGCYDRIANPETHPDVLRYEIDRVAEYDANLADLLRRELLV